MKSDIKKFLVTEHFSLKEIMVKMDQTHKKILFVIGKKKELLGSVTDGDIRRSILKYGTLDTSLEKVFNKNPYSIKKNYNSRELKNAFLDRKIAAVPVVDEFNRVEEIIFWDEIFQENIRVKGNKKIRVPVVIMAGGEGKRLEPFTQILPKPLIPVGDKSIIERIIDKFLDYNVKHFFISVNHKAKIIKSYFEEVKPSYRITYLNEDKPLGTIGVLKKLHKKIKGDICVTNCDIIIDADYEDVLNYHRKNKNLVTIVASLKNYEIPYGICEIENGGKLIAFKEKPRYDFLVSTGMYIINSEVLMYIPTNKLYHITSLIEKVKEKYKVGVYPISENSWIDIGEWAEYKKSISKLIY